MVNWLNLNLISRSGQKAAGSISGRVYTCKTCNRGFPTFQALGGHRASHSKPTGEGNSDGSVEKSKKHKCTICSKEFVLGQALGGHMRKHRSAVEEEEKKILRQSSMCNIPAAVAYGVKILLLPKEKLAPTEIVPPVPRQAFEDRTNWESVHETPTVTHNFFPGEEVRDTETPPQRESMPELKRFNSIKSISCLDLDLKLKPSWVDD